MKCEEYDYFEIVCLYHYPVKLTLRDNLSVEGIAIDIQYNDKRDECIQIQANDEIKSVELSLITHLEVTIDNPHFKRYTFNSS